jgi:hypothetical protein
MQRKEGFIVRIKIKDEHGHVVGETDAIAYKGLLSVAHDEGLKFVKTEVVQVPSEDNGKTAIVRATVRTRRGVFTGIGDANPSNVNKRVAPHVLRMAETRAVARALRVAVNIGDVAIEELGDDFAIDTGTARPANGSDRGQPAPPGNNGSNGGNGKRTPEPFRGRDDRPTEVAPDDRRAMSDMQKKYLYRLAFDLGETRDTARDRVLKALGVERLEYATRVDASRAITDLNRELEARKLKRGNGAEAPS